MSHVTRDCRDSMVYRRAPSVRSLLVFLNLRQHSHELSFSDLLSGLTIAGNFEVPAASPASSSNKREREDSDDESQKSAIVAPQSPNQRNQQQRASPLNAAPAYPSVTTDSNFPRRASMQMSAASSSALAPGMPSDTYHHHHTPPPPRQLPPPPAAPKENLNSLLLKPYQSSYIPLGGSSGLGAAVEPTTPPYRTSSSPATTTTATGYTSPRSPTENMILASDIARGQLYDMSTTTPNSPLQPPPPPPTAVDFMFTGTGTGGGPGMEFGGGGYGGGGGGGGMPVAYKEAMRRQFAPVLQDGQIGVDQDTMMMWSTMPTTYECVIYFSSYN